MLRWVAKCSVDRLRVRHICHVELLWCGLKWARKTDYSTTVFKSNWEETMQISVEDKTLAGFNDPAKTELEKAARDFIEALVKESNRIEATRNPSSGNPQVTSSMVTDAAVLIRRGLARPERKWGAKTMRILAAVLSLAVGFSYDATKLQDKTYMLVFVVVVALAILATTISIIME